ncbi:MAG: CotH kinase family protein [Chitinophagaceae bacterium]|nr:CotH kinase family protein [Chitinophagaceae bacterium]
MMKNIFLTLMGIYALCSFGCRKGVMDVIPPAEEDAIPSFQLFSFTAEDNRGNLSESIICSVHNDTISGYYPLNTDASALVASFDVTGDAQVSVNDHLQESHQTANDFSAPVTYTLTSDSTTRRYVVLLKKFTGLPILYINTDGGKLINSKEIAVTGTLTVEPGYDKKFDAFSGEASFYIRGNSTASYPKKPYKIKFSKKTGLLGMPAAKKWVLLANYNDKTLLRTHLAFKISEILGMKYTPRSQFAELVINGKYAGNYQLTEKIDINKNRLDIKEMEEDDIAGDALTGGYLLEADNKREEEDHLRFDTPNNNRFVLQEPSEATTQQFDYISNYVSNAETALYADNFATADGYKKYLDPVSFAQYFLVNELTRNNDAGFWTSTYLYKDRNSMLNMGPVWDFDIAFGNTTYNDNHLAKGWWMKNQVWFDRLFQDVSFVELVKEQWQHERKELDSLVDILDEMAVYLCQSQIENFKTWDIMNVYLPHITSELTGSYDGELAHLKDWLTQRIAWIDVNLEAL